MAFVSTTPIRFAHVDAAGIVFYPRYFELLNGAFEDWLASVAGVDFATLHLDWRIGTPIVNIEATFQHPGRLGEMLYIELTLERLGTSSLTMAARFTVDGAPRLQARLTSVCMNLGTGRAMPWPPEMRASMADHLAGA